MSTEAALTTAAPRFATPRTDRPTYGHEVARLARVLGFEPMGHQRLFWDIALEHDGTGKLVYREVGLGLPRQNGKTIALLMLMLWRCLRRPGQVVAYAAQTQMDARSRLADTWVPLLEHSPLDEVVNFRRQSGHEGLIFANGSRLGLLASSEKSGHGSTLDLGVLDEAWAHPDHRLEQSVRPAMVTRENAQMVITSTAGTEARSPFWWSKVCAGRQAVEAGVTTGMAYLEWSAPDGDDPSAPETWRKAIPALGTTITEDTIRGDLRGMLRHDFERSFLNRFTSVMGDGVIGVDLWNALAEPDAERPPNVILGVDLSPRSKSAAIAAAGPRDGLMYVSVLEHRDGSGWLAPRLEGLQAEYGDCEVLADRKACAAIWGEIEDLGVVEVDGTGAAEACAYFIDLATRERLRHRAEPELATALDGAALRPLGDAHAWNRKTSGCDISPLCAVTLAAFGRPCWRRASAHRPRLRLQAGP